MKYELVKSRSFATGSIPDGYFGDRANVLFSLIPNWVGKSIVAVTDCGYFRLGLPAVIDESEALWMLQNRPDRRNFQAKAI